jgi:DNA gyrase inhibitor GyrI
MSENRTRLLTDVRIEKLDPCRVACYRAVGKHPEQKAWQVLNAWAERNGLPEPDSTNRRFGFNNPNPSADDSEYGYEVWRTVGNDVKESDDITIRDFEGGLYAVMQTDLTQIGENWRALVRWVESGKYRMSSGQCLEECISPPGTSEDSLVLDLYLPVAE